MPRFSITRLIMARNIFYSPVYSRRKINITDFDTKVRAKVVKMFAETLGFDGLFTTEVLLDMVRVGLDPYATINNWDCSNSNRWTVTFELNEWPMVIEVENPMDYTSYCSKRKIYAGWIGMTGKKLMHIADGRLNDLDGVNAICELYNMAKRIGI